MGWTVRGSNPGGSEIFRICTDRSWGPPSLLYNGFRVFSGVKNRPGRDAHPSPLVVPLSRKSRALPLLPLWAVRPVQSLSACTRVHFYFGFPLKVSPLPIPHWSIFKFNSSSTDAVWSYQFATSLKENYSANINKNPTRCNSTQIFIYCKVTLLVSGVTAPIIRGTKKCNRSLRYRS